MTTARLLGLAILLLWPTLAHGWNDTGHRITCEIAYQELGDTARAEVDRLLALDDTFTTFADACTWADHPPRRPHAHFVPLPRSTRNVNRAECPGRNECLFSAIRRDERTLADPDASDRERLEALKYLGHWIGDLHQPLHVTHKDDEFGAKIVVKGLACASNLHDVWDSCLVEEGLGRNVRGIATALRRDLQDVLRRSWIEISPARWADESFKIAIAPDVEYCIKKDGRCWSTRERIDHGPNVPARTLDAEYIERLRLATAGCMQRAGVRLGARLNAILGPSRAAD